jgi:hypothetical protein
MERWTWSGLVWSCHNAIGRVGTLLCRTTERGCGKTAVHMSAGRDVVAFAGVGVGVLTIGAYLRTDPATCRGQLDYDSNRHSDGIQMSGERQCFDPEASARIQLHRASLRRRRIPSRCRQRAVV